MKKFQKKLAIVIAMMLPLCSAAQYDLKYLPCKTCTGTNTAVGFKINSSTSDITSDYGKRNSSGNSTWHRGVDLVVSGVADFKGYHILSPFNATIAKIAKLGNYIILAIDGPGDNNLGFGHIFENGTLPITIGDMVLTSVILINEPEPINIILDKTTGKAWCQESGIGLTYGGVNYLTTNQVMTGDRLAPIGDSDANGVVHLHLYRHVNPMIDLQGVANCKDPLKILNHMNSDMNITSYDPYALTPAQAATSYYPGDQSSCMKVACNMNGNNFLPEDIMSSYQHRLMAIDKVKFFIGKASAANEAVTSWGEVNSAFQLAKGPNYTGIICNGSLPNTTIYPVTLSDNNFGSNTHTGIYPYAYSSATKDDYFFADFYQRLHMNSVSGSGAASFAKCIAEAMYPDGEYRLLARAETIEGLFFGTSFEQSKVIRIDNFLPYIKKVKVLKSNSINPFYKAEWLWDGSSLNYVNPVNIPGSGGSGLSVIVTTSEPMKELALSYNSYSSGILIVGLPGTDNTEFVFAIPQAYVQTGEETLIFEGKDLDGNKLQIMNEQYPLPASQISVRTGNNSWSPPPNTGLDKVHKISIGEIAPPIAGFSPLLIDINPGNYVYFQDASTGIIDAWSWFCPGGTPLNSNLQNPGVQYDQAGDYPVTLTVVNSLGTNAATGMVHVSDDPVNPVCDFTPKNVTIAEGTTIYYSDLSSGTPTTWWWDFDGVSPFSFDPNPEVTYDYSGIYNVNLTVSNAVGMSTCASTVMVVPEEPALEMMCLVNPFMGSPGLVCNFSADILSGTPPYQMVFNYGDGTVIPQNTSSSWVSTNHQYLNPGNYTLVVSVTDAGGHYQTCYEYIIVLPSDPCESFLLKLKVDGSESQTALPFGTAHVFSAEPFGGNPTYYYVWTFYPDALTGAQPSMIGSYQPGPHTVTFPAAGNYTVKVHVCDAHGCTRTITRNYTIYEPEHCMVAIIQKKQGGELSVPLGQNCFYDFSRAVSLLQCLDPPGSMDIPCITNSHWELKTFPAGGLLATKDCYPYTQPMCAMGSVNDRLFSYNFTQKGLYKMSLKVWDNDCNVQAGYDCEDETEVLVRAMDCDETIIVNEDVPSPQQGLNPDVFGGTIISGNANGFFLGPDYQMNWFANHEIAIKPWASFFAGCSFQATIIPCPEPFCDKIEQFTTFTVPSPVIEVYPNPGKGLFAVRITAGAEKLQNLEVYNCLGEKIKTVKGDGQLAASIDITSFPAGLYILKASLDKSTQSLKITKY